MTNSILPVMRRAQILPDTLSARIDEELSSNKDLHGLLISFWVDDTMSLVSMAPRFIVETDAGPELQWWNVLEHRGEVSLEIASLGLHLMNCFELNQGIEDLTGSLPIRIGEHFISVIFLPHCVIVSHDHENPHVHEHHKYFAEEPEEETTRAPLCTMLLKPQKSAHDMLDEHIRVARDLEIFRKITKEAIKTLKDEHGLILADPSPADLLAVEPL